MFISSTVKRIFVMHTHACDSFFNLKHSDFYYSAPCFFSFIFHTVL